MNNTFLVIGSGKYGLHLACYLCEMDNEVMLVDKNETLIEEYSHKVTSAEIGDCTIKSNLESLGVSDYDYVFVAVGSFQDSLVIVDHLKDLGAKCVIAKASSEIHEKFLLKNGADKVVYPERDFAYRSAVEYSNKKVFDYTKISDDAGIYEIETPDKWCGKSVGHLNIRRIHNVTIIAAKNIATNIVTAINTADYVFNKNEHLIVMGTSKDIRKITKG